MSEDPIPDKEDPIETYIKFVTHYIDLMGQYTDPLRETNDIDVHKVKNVLGNRMAISNTMTIELQRYKRQLKLHKREYKIWYSTEYASIRKRVNPTGLAASKWLGKSDIEAEIIKTKDSPVPAYEAVTALYKFAQKIKDH